MIVSIAGTSGAGKTTLARALISQAEHREDVTRDRKVIGASLELPGKNTTFLVGRYQDGLQTCGCDTIKDVVRVYELVDEYARLGFNVVYEGLFVMNHTRGPELARRHRGSITVIRLTNSLEECKRSVNERRAAQGEPPLASWKNTEGNHKRATNYGDKMRNAGANVIYVRREEALPRLMEVLS